MSRASVSLTALSANDFTAKPTMTALSTDGMQIDVGGKTDDVLLHFNFSVSGSCADAVSIAAGGNPPAFRSGLGDLDFAFSGSAAAADYFCLVESARFVQNTSGSAGFLFIDVGSLTSGSIAAYRLGKV